MFDNLFAHYLSYGATDQQTARTLAGEYTGLLVPGTIAAFQREGTGGFVLSLSATTEQPEYAIDPRFPLFQQALMRPKKSHIALAELLGAPELVRDRNPIPSDFSEEIIERVAAAWAGFNGNYQAAAGSKFAKYARRLGKDVQPQNARRPTYVLPPYLMVSSLSDPWWAISKRLHEVTRAKLGDDDRCVRVIATKDVSALSSLLESVPDKRIAIWVSGLEELASTDLALATYASAIADARERGVQLFALYGGFFSVMLQNLGLCGASHGIGFGEYRKWIELPESGPPPARYYLPQLHRYVQVDDAARLYFADRQLAECACTECNREPPVGLEYHALMRHSVRCRALEISEWAGLNASAMAARLREELADFHSRLNGSDLPAIAIDRATRLGRPMDVWATALERL